MGYITIKLALNKRLKIVVKFNTIVDFLNSVVVVMKLCGGI